MSKKFPKIHSIHFGGIWIGISLVIGLILPLVIWLCFGHFVWQLSAVGAVILAAFAVVFWIEMRQDNGKIPYYEKNMKNSIPFDPEKQEAVIRASICTGEKVAGFKNKADGHFTEVMVIHSGAEEEHFKKMYGVSEIKKEW